MERDDLSEEPLETERTAGSVRCLSEFVRARELLFVQLDPDVAVWVWVSPAAADLDGLIATVIHIDGEGALLAVSLRDAGVSFCVRGERYLVPWASLEPTALLRIREVMHYQAASASSLLNAAADRAAQRQLVDSDSYQGHIVH